MNLHPDRSRRFPRRACAALFFLLLFSLPALATPTGATTPFPFRVPATTATVSPVVLAEGWTWGKLYHYLESALGSRRHMLQFGVIGMCIALYIMMRK